MKKYLIALAGASLIGALPLVASAGEDNIEGGYISGNVQFVAPEDADGTRSGAAADYDFDNGYGIGIAGGYAMPNHFRVEAELTYRDNDYDVTSGGVTVGDDIDSLALMANLLYDVDTNSPIVPYFGGGLGAVDINGDETVFAYQAMAGAAYRLDQHQEVYAGYRYFGSDGVQEAANNIDYSTHNAEVGYRFRF